jgi:hypothetical protein
MLTDEHKLATKKALRMLGRLRAMNKLPSEFKPGVPVVVALEHEAVSDVMARVTTYGPPVVLVVYYPVRDRIEIVTLEPGEHSSKHNEESVQVNARTSIGMIVDAGGSPLAVQGQWSEFHAQKVNLATA